MSAVRTISHEPAGKGMTLDELAAFVQDALRSGARGGEFVKVRVNFGGTIKRAEVEIRAAETSDEKTGG
jgi:hypothetical protein